MNDDWAISLKVGPVIPGAAAFAEGVTNSATAIITAKTSCVFHIMFFIFVDLIAVLLVNVDFGHQSAEVLRVVRQVVKIGGVEVIGTRWHSSAVQNHIEGLTAGQSDRVRFVVHIVSLL